MLSVEGLKVRYGQIEAVKGLDFTVAQGEIVTLLGANGAGKTSTLAAIAGLASATGVIRFENQNLIGLRPEDISRRSIALTPEGRRVFPALTVAENLLLGGAMHHKGASLDATREEMLTLFPILRERYRQRAGLLSGGEQQMLAIARSLMSQPRLLLLDEPSLGLAPKIVDEVFRLIAGLRQKGITILLVEQNAVRALDIADRGYVLVNGRITLQGKGRELAQSDEVRAAYLAA
jgi:branched-chain amino acid transport system ATP-binding protein